MLLGLTTATSMIRFDILLVARLVNWPVRVARNTPLYFERGLIDAVDMLVMALSMVSPSTLVAGLIK